MDIFNLTKAVTTSLTIFMKIAYYYTIITAYVLKLIIKYIPDCLVFGRSDNVSVFKALGFHRDLTTVDITNKMNLYLKHKLDTSDGEIKVNLSNLAEWIDLGYVLMCYVKNSHTADVGLCERALSALKTIVDTRVPEQTDNGDMLDNKYSNNLDELTSLLSMCGSSIDTAKQHDAHIPEDALRSLFIDFDENTQELQQMIPTQTHRHNPYPRTKKNILFDQVMI